MKTKRIALIGANGQLGTDICQYFSAKQSFEIIPLTHADLEITDATHVAATLRKLKPEIIINTTAYHKVDEIEDNPEKAFAVNAVANKSLAQFCHKNGMTLVFISSDYVFGLDKRRVEPYVESDLPGPVNTYGISKLAGESFINAYCPTHFIIRSTGLFGAAGASGKGGNFIELMLRLAKEKGEVSVVNDQIMTPTSTQAIAANLHELLQTDRYGLYHMTSQGSCSWYDFAREIFRLTKTKVKLEAVSSEAFPSKAKRPSYSVLDNHNLQAISLDLMPTWQAALKTYLHAKRYL